MLSALALGERGFKRPLYGTPAMLNADFIKIGGKSVEGILVSAGPSIVAEQLPDSHYSKHLSLQYRDLFKKANGVDVNDAFSAYSFDAWLMFLDAAKHVAEKNVEAGWPTIVPAARRIFSTTDFWACKASQHSPGAWRSGHPRPVIVRLLNGAWTYEP